MDDLLMKMILTICLLSVIFEVTVSTSNETWPDEYREPRVSGQIVKLYSGTKSEAIFCPEEGFQADPTNCAVFYRCVKGFNGKYTVFRFQCGPGTVYDPDVEVCNHPRSTKRSECGGLVAAPPTNHGQDNEIDGVRPDLPSPISTKNPYGTTAAKEIITKSTVYPWATSTSRPSQLSSSSTVKQWTTTTLATKVSTLPPSSTGSDSPHSQSGDKCSTDGFMGDSENCRKFYRCVGNQRGGFTRYEFTCSESTIWDDDAQSCNYAWAVQRRRCGRVTSDDNLPQKPTDEFYDNEVSPKASIQQQLQIAYGSKVNQTQTQISHGPVIQNQTQISYGDRVHNHLDSKVKQNQTQITHGSAVSQSQTQINYGNKGAQSQLQVDHTHQSSQAQTQEYESNTKMTTTVIHDEPDSGSGQPVDSQPANQQGEGGITCSQSGFIGDKKDCKKFYRCVENEKGTYTKYEFSCGEGTVWDSNIEACNHAWAVKDCKSQSSAQSSTHNPTETTQKTTTIMTTDNYYTTVDQTTEGEDDVGYGNQNEQTSSTTWKPETTSSENNNSDGTSCTSSGFVGDANNCKKFYRCVDNGGGSFTKYEYKCGEGTVWDPNIEACNHSWAVKKCGGIPTDVNKIETTTKRQTTASVTTVSLIHVTTTQTSSQSVDYDTDVGYGQHSNEPPAISTTSKVPQNQEVDANKCKSSGFMGDKNDCKKFYRCVDNGNGSFTRYEFSCGEGTLWDQKIEACNHAWAVDKCGDDTTTDTYKETSSSSRPTVSDEEIVADQTTSNHEETGQPEQTTTKSENTGKPQNNQSSKCQSNGFFGDKNDCKKFFRCVDDGKGGFTYYEFTCGEGTVWDQSIEACNHAAAVKTCGTSTSSGLESQSQATTPFYATSAVNEDQGYEQSSSEKSTTSKLETQDTEASTICKKEGFAGDPKDCKKFYRCVDNGNGRYTKYEFTCGEGTVWDPDIEACNHPPLDGSCRGGWGEATSEEPNRENDEAYTTAPMASAPSSSPNYSESTEIQNPPTERDKCQTEGFFGDASNCKKFFRCVDDGKGGFTKYDFSCGDGTVWDQEIQGCNHASNSSDCSKTSSNTQSMSTESESNASPTTSASTNIDNQEITRNPDATRPTPSDSIDTCTSEGFFGNSDDCRKFFRCVDNGKGGFTKYDFSCGEGTVWVQDIQSCDHDNGDFKCKQSVTSQGNAQAHTEANDLNTDSSISSTTSSTQSHQPITEDDEYSIDTSSTSSTLSDDKCKSEGFYPNKNDCRRFYRCVENGNGGYTKYDFTCGEGTAWDHDIQGCNHISQVSSCDTTSQQETQSKPMQDEDSPQTTIADGSSSSVTTSSATESSKPAKSDKCDQEGYFGNTEDCKKFYRCVDNGKGGFTKYDYTCGEGTIWDQDITACNHPQDVTNPSCTETESSSSSSSESSSSTSSSTDSSSSSSSSTTQTNQGSDCSEESSSKKPANKNVTCDKAGYYADPNDCKKFYRCVDWDGDGKRFSVYHFDCGEGTIWDPALDTCNHEDSVYPPRDCSGTQSQSENVGEESTSTEEASTTSEDTTTTEQSTTSEQTTTQQTTTQETTTTEQTTTDQPTTSEKTTEQITTSEQTTTQQSTTEQTTSQQTTSEETTTQQTTTAEQTTAQETTTQQTTTSEQTTKQQTTQQTENTEKTTQQSTTEQTTTEQTDTDNNDQSTTEQATTTEESTEQQSTTESETSGTTESQTSGTTESQTSETTESQTSETTESQTSETTESQTSETTESQTSGTTESEMTDESTTSQTDSSTTDSESTTENQSTTESSSSSDKDCPETEDDQNVFVCPTSFRRHPKYCNLFYQCTEEDDSHDLKIATFNCPNNTIYDESKTKCVEEDKSDKKCDGEIAQKRRLKRLDTTYKEPMVVTNERLKCPAVGHFPFEKQECSPAFLKCERAKSGSIRGYVYQCPVGYFYWSVSRRCEPKGYIRDCKQSYNDWNGRWEIPVERRNVAP